MTASELELEQCHNFSYSKALYQHFQRFYLFNDTGSTFNDRGSTNDTGSTFSMIQITHRRIYSDDKLDAAVKTGRANPVPPYRPTLRATQCAVTVSLSTDRSLSSNLSRW